MPDGDDIKCFKDHTKPLRPETNSIQTAPLAARIDRRHGPMRLIVVRLLLSRSNASISPSRICAASLIRLGTVASL